MSTWHHFPIYNMISLCCLTRDILLLCYGDADFVACALYTIVENFEVQLTGGFVGRSTEVRIRMVAY
jgi:hypothetical protein